MILVWYRQNTLTILFLQTVSCFPFTIKTAMLSPLALAYSKVKVQNILTPVSHRFIKNARNYTVFFKQKSAFVQKKKSSSVKVTLTSSPFIKQASTMRWQALEQHSPKSKSTCSHALSIQFFYFTMMT